VVPVESAGQAIEDFLRLGDDVEILEPAALREQVARTAGAIVARYSRPEAASAEQPARARSPG